MAKQIGEEKASQTAESSIPRPADALIESGWKYYAKKEYAQAEDNFRKALEFEPDNADTLYALAMSEQAGGRRNEAIEAFEKVIQHLEENKAEDPVRFLMLTRLANGHISRLKTGIGS